MAHLTARSAYRNLAERLNRFPQGAPQSEVLYKILSILFSEEEADFVARLSIKPFTAEKAARLGEKPLKEAEKMLEALASRGLLLDTGSDGDTLYTLPPPMAGFFEFALMRYRTDIDQKLLSELFYQYLNTEDDFVRDLFYSSETKLGRAFVNEEALKRSAIIEVMDYERGSEAISSARHLAVGICYCRHKMEHIGKACNAPMEVCLTLNGVADSLTRHNVARRISRREGLDILQKAYDNNLIQLGDNVQNEVSFICNCCSCCCEALVAAKQFGFLNPVATTNYIPEINEKCSGCGICIKVCPVQAIESAYSDPPDIKTGKKVMLNTGVCLGCGLCVKSCSKGGIKLVKREKRIITPVNSVHRIVMTAIEKGKLQNLIFDSHALWNHRAMAAILGVILKLPPVSQLMASRQFKSRYLEKLILKYGSQ